MKKAAFLFFRVEVRNAACAVQYLVIVQTMLVRCPKNLDFTVFQKVSLSNLIFGARVVIAVTFQQVDDTPDTKTSAQSDNESLKNGNCLFKKCHK